MALDFGIEIECLAPTPQDENYRVMGQMTGPRVAAAIVAKGVPCNYVGYSHEVQRGSWKIVTDGSLRPFPGFAGLEIVSPPLGDEGLAQVELVCAALHEFGARVNTSCGLHVHIGARHLPITAMRKLGALYAENEDIIDSLLPPSRRGNANIYCNSVKTRVNLSRLATANSVTDIAAAVSDGGRYTKLNFTSFWRYGTVEFRHHSGTIDATKITKWILLCSKMVERAKEQASEPIVATATTPRTPRGSSRSLLFQLAMRPEGVTALEYQRALGWTSKPSMPWSLTKLGFAVEQVGTRERQKAWKIAVAVTIAANGGPPSLEGLLEKLGLSDEDKAFWQARRAMLFGATAESEA